jgi:hypothetical protein
MKLHHQVVTSTLFSMLNSRNPFEIEGGHIYIKGLDFFPEENSWIVEVYAVMGVIGDQTFLEKGRVSLRLVDDVLQGVDNNSLEVAVISIVERVARQSVLNELLTLTEAEDVPIQDR